MAKPGCWKDIFIWQTFSFFIFIGANDFPFKLTPMTRLFSFFLPPIITIFQRISFSCFLINTNLCFGKVFFNYWHYVIHDIDQLLLCRWLFTFLCMRSVFSTKSIVCKGNSGDFDSLSFYQRFVYNFLHQNPMCLQNSRAIQIHIKGYKSWDTHLLNSINPGWQLSRVAMNGGGVEWVMGFSEMIWHVINRISWCYVQLPEHHGMSWDTMFCNL